MGTEIVRGEFEFTIPRRCDRCEEQYQCKRTFQGEGLGPDGAQQSAAQHAEQLNDTYGRETFGTFCPYCHCFASKALARHFPNGLREGIVAKVRKGGKLSPGTGMFVIGAAVVSLGLAFSLGVIGIVLAFLVMSAAIAGFLYKQKLDADKVREMLRPLSDDQIKRLVYAAYKKSDDCLSVTALTGSHEYWYGKMLPESGVTGSGVVAEVVSVEPSIPGFPKLESQSPTKRVELMISAILRNADIQAFGRSTLASFAALPDAIGSQKDASTKGERSTSEPIHKCAACKAPLTIEQVYSVTKTGGLPDDPTPKSAANDEYMVATDRVHAIVCREHFIALYKKTGKELGTGVLSQSANMARKNLILRGEMKSRG